MASKYRKMNPCFKFWLKSFVWFQNKKHMTVWKDLKLRQRRLLVLHCAKTHPIVGEVRIWKFCLELSSVWVSPVKYSLFVIIISNFVIAFVWIFHSFKKNIWGVLKVQICIPTSPIVRKNPRTTLLIKFHNYIGVSFVWLRRKMRKTFEKNWVFFFVCFLQATRWI